jgi:hypothetical protein
VYLHEFVFLPSHSLEETDKCFITVADLWKAPSSGKVIGTATAGSSEAIMLGGLAMKKKWQEARKAAGKDYFHPNVVFGANCQVALEKFARYVLIRIPFTFASNMSPRRSYFDVECRLVPVTAEGDFVMQPKDAIQYIDENTIGVMVILGSTYTGHFENVQQMSDLRASSFLHSLCISLLTLVLAPCSGQVASRYRTGYPDPRRCGVGRVHRAVCVSRFEVGL